jgi:hypothetical protein
MDVPADSIIVFHLLRSSEWESRDLLGGHRLREVWRRRPPRTGRFIIGAAHDFRTRPLLRCWPIAVST